MVLGAKLGEAGRIAPQYSRSMVLVAAVQLPYWTKSFEVKAAHVAPPYVPTVTALDECEI